MSGIRDECEKYVNNPGKFEGENRYLPHLYNQIFSAECMASRRDTVESIHRIVVIEVDVKIFPELEGVDDVFIHEDNHGFVTELEEEEAKEIAREINEEIEPC